MRRAVILAGGRELFIEKAAAELKSGCLLATGDIDSLSARMRGKSWRTIHSPTYMHYFSVTTLSKLLGRQGMEVAHASHPGNSRRLRSVLYFIFALKLKRPALYEALVKLPFSGMRLTVNVSDVPLAPLLERSERRSLKPLRASTHDDFRAYA